MSVCEFFFDFRMYRLRVLSGRGVDEFVRSRYADYGVLEYDHIYKGELPSKRDYDLFVFGDRGNCVDQFVVFVRRLNLVDEHVYYKVKRSAEGELLLVEHEALALGELLVVGYVFEVVETVRRDLLDSGHQHVGRERMSALLHSVVYISQRLGDLKFRGRDAVGEVAEYQKCGRGYKDA